MLQSACHPLAAQTPAMSSTHVGHLDAEHAAASRGFLPSNVSKLHIVKLGGHVKQPVPATGVKRHCWAVSLQGRCLSPGSVAHQPHSASACAAIPRHPRAS